MEVVRRYTAKVVFEGRELALALFMLVTGVAMFAAGGAQAAFGIMLGVIGLLTTAFYAGRRRRALLASARHASAELEVRKGSLVVLRADGTRERVAKEKIASAWIVPGDRGGARVFIAGRRRRILSAWLPSLEDARELLAELQLGPLDRPVTFSFFFGLRVTVGVDGVLVAWPLLGRRRFIPHDRIDDVRWTNERVALLLKDGSRYEIDTNAKNPAARDADAALVERLRAAREAYAASEGAEPLAVLARGGRSAEAWVRELRATGEQGGSQYRTAALPAETLWRIALDASEEEEVRIGASLALRAALDDEGRTKLRVAANAAASPRVRVALAAAADDDDDDDEAVAAAIRHAR